MLLKFIVDHKNVIKYGIIYICFYCWIFW